MLPLSLLTLLLTSACAHAFGVVVLDAESMELLAPVESNYEVYVENQIAITHLQSEYINPSADELEPVWVLPLASSASATRLRYRMNGSWTDVPIAPGPQDPGLPGDEVHPTLRAYMGNSPLVFHFENPLPPDSTLLIELDYVELLPYAFGTVTMRQPGNLQSLLPNHILSSAYHLELASDRDILSLSLSSGHSGADVGFAGGSGQVDWSDPAGYATEEFIVDYQLDQDQLGLFTTSTMLPDSLMPEGEDGPPGFLVFLAEPDPHDQTAVIDKVFTFIIDRSGSMAGAKMQQARAAASFIVQHLNEGDRFNLLAFYDFFYSFQTQHVPYTPQSEAQALSWISQQTDTDRGTNISGAFQIAVPQFSNATDSTANIIIFFTDGIPNGGITNEQQLVNYVDGLFQQQPAHISLFCFGIGEDVNGPLLGQLAAHNGGFAEFLRNDELEDRISDFYLRIRNPVLLQPWMEAVPDLLQQTAPFTLPSLYIGSQMIVAERYDTAAPIMLTLHGNANGQPVQYEYPVALASTYNDSRAFLPKVWAKSTIESLMIAYYQLDPESTEAQELEQDIINLSMTWGVVSPFTSFNDGETALPDEEPARRPSSLLLVDNYPNPFNPTTTLRITVPAGLPRGPLFIRIYNLRGELVRTLALVVTGPGVYEIIWNGCDARGGLVASGAYLVMASCADQIVAHRIMLLK